MSCVQHTFGISLFQSLPYIEANTLRKMKKDTVDLNMYLCILFSKVCWFCLSLVIKIITCNSKLELRDSVHTSACVNTWRVCVISGAKNGSYADGSRETSKKEIANSRNRKYSLKTEYHYLAWPTFKLWTKHGLQKLFHCREDALTVVGFR